MVNDRVGKRRPFAGVRVDPTWRDPVHPVRVVAVRRTADGLLVVFRLAGEVVVIDVDESRLLRFRDFCVETYDAIGRWPRPPKNAGETAAWWAAELKSAGFRPSNPPVKPAEPDQHVVERYQQLKVAAGPRERLCA